MTISAPPEWSAENTDAPLSDEAIRAITRLLLSVSEGLKDPADTSKEVCVDGLDN